MAEFITVTATKAHLKEALTPASMRNVTSACLAAQAIKAVVGRKPVNVFGETATVAGYTYDVSKKGQSLVNKFDDISAAVDEKAGKKKLSALRAKLPVTFRLTLRSQEPNA
jgi:hypothetical protein